MGFAGVFQNIDFMAPTRQAQREAQNFQTMVGKVVDKYQEGQVLKQKQEERKQKEAQMKLDKMMDMGKMAEEGLMLRALGMPTTEFHDAAIESKALVSSDQMYIDPATREVQFRPSGWSRAAGQGGQAMPQPLPGMGTQRQAAMEGNIARMQGGMPTDITPRPMTQKDIEGVLGGQPIPGEVPQGPPIDAFKAPGADLPPIRQLEVDQDAAKVFAEGSARQKLKVQNEKFDEFIINSKNIPLVEQMIKFNEGTVDLPFAEMMDPAAKLLSPEQADNLGLLRQNQLELAAPLAKALGVNPTDKDFEASLRRIVDLNSTKTGRRKQLENVLQRMKKKAGQSKFNEGQTATHPKTGARIIFRGGEWQTM